MINGNTSGLKEYILENLDKLYSTKIEKGKIINQEIVDYISEISNKINREINIAIDRSGNIIDISIGDSSTVNLPVVTVYDKKLSGVRIIHTHPGGNPHLSSVDISALIKLKLDCIVSIGVSEEGITGYEVAICSIVNDELTYDRTLLKKLDDFDYLEEIKEVEENLRKRNVIEDDKEYALLIGIDEEEYLDELQELASACDVKVVGRFFQKRSKPDPVFLIGSGKIQELALVRQVRKANLLIFDEELSGLQLKMIEEVTGCKVIDRTTLILEIFARRAKTREAKLQVELAQLKHLSTRLVRRKTGLDQQKGAVGLRGPGETQLETDRRLIKVRIAQLQNRLAKVEKQRNQNRQTRQKADIPTISLVGYTNAGKSTLFNFITQANVYAADQLFATLDPTLRRLQIQDVGTAILADTVGFVRQLPHDLVSAFKSTLQETVEASLLLHVIDAADARKIENIEAVNLVLEEIKADKVPVLLVYNKIDLLENVAPHIEYDDENKPVAVYLSAHSGEGLELLLEAIKVRLKNEILSFTLTLLPQEGKIRHALYQLDSIRHEQISDEGEFILNVQIDKVEWLKLHKQFPKLSEIIY